MNNVKIGDTVRIPGFPALLKVEDISGALGIVSGISATGAPFLGEVFLSQLHPADWYQGKSACVETMAVQSPPPPYPEEGWG